MKTKYYVRLMRPIFQRVILTVEVSSDEAALRAALQESEQLPEAAWAEMETERELAVPEMVFSKDDLEGDSDANAIDYVRDAKSWCTRRTPAPFRPSASCSRCETSFLR